MVSADERVEHISIHALRGEGDVQLGKLLKRLADFNPRPPWGGRHLERYSVLRGHHFNPRPPWGGRQSDVGELPGDIIISIHALRGEGDTSTDSKDSNTNQFQSTPSVGRATPYLNKFAVETEFQSTPSVGRATRSHSACKLFKFYFNPRPPWGGRRRSGSIVLRIRYFNPRPPWGGRPVVSALFCRFCRISIHALRGEGDPLRGQCQRTHRISIHALRGEGDEEC